MKDRIIMEELWGKDPTTDEQLNSAIEEFFKNFNIKIGECLSLFDCLNQDSQIMYK